MFCIVTFHGIFQNHIYHVNWDVPYTATEAVLPICVIYMTAYLQVSCLMAAFRKGHMKVVKWMVNHVTQFPSDQEMTRYISTISDKVLLYYYVVVCYGK